MTEEDLNLLIIDEFEPHGLRLAPIPRTSSKTADLAGTRDGDRFVIEAKQRNRDDEWETLIGDLAVGEIAHHVPEPLAYGNAVASALRDGVAQLTHSAATPEDFRLLWLQGSDHDATTDKERYVNTLTGSVHMLDRRPDGNAYTCHFFGESLFYRFRNELDGAFVADFNEWMMFLNPYSPRYSKLKASGFVHAIDHAVVDPSESLPDQQQLVAWCDLDRRDSAAVLQHLNEKYEMDLMKITIHRYGAAVRAT